jgi:hypothetical protein
MKKIVLLLFIIIGLLCSAQTERFTFSLRTELADKNTHNEVYDYGFNLGAEIGYQMDFIYFDAESYWFPELNGIDYLHFQGTILGFNYHTWDERFRGYIGLLKPGFIYREGPHALFGHDLGLDFYFNEKNYVGIETGLNKKGDSKLWSDDDYHWVWYASVKFGFYW